MTPGAPTESQPPPVEVLVFSTGIGVFMSALDGSIVNISLQTIAVHFSALQSDVQWIVLSYLLTIVSFTTLSGLIGDRLGTKPIFQLGVALFAVGSLLCALSTTLESLIFFRFVQGLGSTGIFANGIAIVTRFTTKANRGYALGWNSSIVALALTTGPILGGFLTESFGWQSVFLVNVPVGVLGLFLVQKLIPATPPIESGPKKVDLLGIITFAGFIAFLILGISSLGRLNETIGTMNAIFSFLLSGAFFVALLVTESRVDSPVFDLKLFRTEKKIPLGVLSAALTFCCLNVLLFQLPYYWQESLGYSPAETGFLILGVPLSMAIVGPISGRMSDKIDARLLSTMGILGLGVITAVLALTLSSISPEIVALLLVLVGTSIAIFASPNGNSVMSASPREKLGVVGGLLGISRSTGFSLGISLSTSFLAIFSSVMDLSIEESYGLGLQMVFAASLALIVVAAILSSARGKEGTEQGYIKEAI